MSNFRPVDRDTGFLLPPSVDEWLPEKHLARFVVEVIDGLDLGGNVHRRGRRQFRIVRHHSARTRRHVVRLAACRT